MRVRAEGGSMISDILIANCAIDVMRCQAPWIATKKATVGALSLGLQRASSKDARAYLVNDCSDAAL